MPQFMSVEVSGDQIADLMMEDGAFAFEVWTKLAERLHMGAMADDLSDLLGCCQDKSRARHITNTFLEAFGTAKSLHFPED